VAVDYDNYILVSGPHDEVRTFVHRIAKTASRRVAGVTHTDFVPFSLDSLFQLANIRDEFPGEPYDMTRWPIEPRGRGHADVRYRFHTRQLEMQPLLKKLSRTVPRLRIALVTLCLDDSDFGAFTFQAGKIRGKWLGDKWCQPFWKEAARRANMDLEEAYEDDDMATFAESLMRDAAMKIATGSNRTYRWRGGRVYRDFDEARWGALDLLSMIVNADKKEKPRRAAAGGDDRPPRRSSVRRSGRPSHGRKLIAHFRCGPAN
jgi:hypothetical protein